MFFFFFFSCLLSWSSFCFLDRFLGRVLVFFYKFPSQASQSVQLIQQLSNPDIVILAFLLLVLHSSSKNTEWHFQWIRRLCILLGSTCPKAIWKLCLPFLEIILNMIAGCTGCSNFLYVDNIRNLFMVYLNDCVKRNSLVLLFFLQ